MFHGAVLLLVLAATATPMLGHNAQLAKWNEFKRTYGKSYATAEEENRRFNIFIENQRYIDQHNQEFKAGKHTFTVGVNKFADMTNKEFTSRMNGYRMPSGGRPAAPVYQKPAVENIPDSVDWRTQGYVTEVKDQGQCGACWAFGVTGGLEGQHKKKTGQLVSLSEQNLVDCGGKEGLSGCNGGNNEQAFKFIKDEGGVDTEASYPYTAKDGNCKFNTSNIGATDTGYVILPDGDEDAFTSAIANIGPISVGIDASHPSFQAYTGGVYYEPACSSTQRDHSVLTVGYGATDDGTQYYIVKNSWGPGWGEQGYIRMARNRDDNCGIASDGSYPTV